MARAKLGKPLKPAGEFAKPTDEEIDNVNRRWDENAPARFVGLLDAVPLGTEGTNARWFWDVKRGQYVDRRGRYLSKKELRQAWIEYRKALAKK